MPLEPLIWNPSIPQSRHFFGGTGAVVRAERGGGRLEHVGKCLEGSRSPGRGRGAEGGVLPFGEVPTPTARTRECCLVCRSVFWLIGRRVIWLVFSWRSFMLCWQEWDQIQWLWMADHFGTVANTCSRATQPPPLLVSLCWFGRVELCSRQGELLKSFTIAECVQGCVELLPPCLTSDTVSSNGIKVDARNDL